MRAAAVSILALVLGAAGTAAASETPAPAPASPYAGQQSRSIKALSPEQIGDLAEGRGMGLAKAAELNGWPGPLHVLELAGPLNLDPGQRRDSEALYKRMQAQARLLGGKVLAAEAELEAAFRNRQVTPAEVDRLLRKIGALGAELRGAHLRAHLEQTALLRPEQVRHYAVLRGYGTDAKAAPAEDQGQGQGHRHGHRHRH